MPSDSELAAAASDASRRGRVWLADDSPAELAHTRGLLTRAYDVESFSDGGALLERLAGPDVAPPDLLLLDWHMPGVSGLEVCRFLRERFSRAALPILVLTASTQEEDLAEAFGAGVNDYVAKPVRGAELLARVSTLFEVRWHAERLRQSEERLRRVVQASGTATWELDASSLTFTADAQQAALMGQPAAPMAQSLAALLEGVHPEDRERTRRAIDAALAGEDGGRYHVELRPRPAGDAPTRWLEGRGQALFDAEGRPLRVVGTSVDVTARKRAEAAREELLASLGDQPVFGVALLRGPELVFERVNATYQQVVGGRDVAGKPLLQALPELVGQGFDALLHGVQRSGVPYIGREVLVLLDRRGQGVLENAYFNYVYQPVRGPGGPADDVLMVTHDVTDMVLARQEAERLMAVEKERAGFEQQLIGIVSHDLRNPVAAITMGAASMLRRSDLEERQRRTAERILTSAGRASRLIHDLLDFTQARLGSGLKIQRTPGDLHAVVREVVEESQVASPGRTLRLEQTGSGEGAWDADRLSQLVGNLLSNALQYSPPQSAVSVVTRGEPDAVLLTVHNGGAPIPAELLPHLFQPLQRGVEAVSAERSVGLGLYIVDQVARAHGGSVSVRSDAEAGTTFTVRLPRAVP